MMSPRFIKNSSVYSLFTLGYPGPTKNNLQNASLQDVDY